MRPWSLEKASGSVAEIAADGLAEPEFKRLHHAESKP